ncbi:MAG: patatin-like phospholipase family protein [Acidobacteriota bacterium]|nr:patatin-like phospholipase family protein [Acidobacteriota bacterium]
MKRAFLMASGANRGAYYAGFLGPLQDAGIEFDLLAGVSAGGIASAWFAAGDPEALIDSWRQADPWRIAPHPWMSVGRLRTVDRLIQNITLQTMDVRAARTARAEVVVAAARVVGPGLPLPKLEPAYLSNRQAADDETFGLMLRATAFVPYINGFRQAVVIKGERYLDGGLVHRVPLSMIPEDRFDEVWIAACSPHGIAELEHELTVHRRRERLVVVTPSAELPVGRWTMEWSKIRRAIDLGHRDMETAINRLRR